MSESVSIADLANALLRRRARTVAELASCLGVDPSDKAALASFEKACRRIVPDIRSRLRSNQERFAGPSRQFPGRNPYGEGKLRGRVWELTRKGVWLDLGSIRLFLGTTARAPSVPALAKAVASVANPWHQDNRGRSFMLAGADDRGAPLHRMVFSVPEAVMEVCERAWGRLPVPQPPPSAVGDVLTEAGTPPPATTVRTGRRPPTSPRDDPDTDGLFETILDEREQDDDWLPKDDAV